METNFIGLPNGIDARFLVIHIEGYTGFGCVRMELYGCITNEATGSTLFN